MQPAAKAGMSFRSCVRRDGPFGLINYTTIYAIEAVHVPKFKFGMTNNIDKRFNGIRLSNAGDVRLFGHLWMPPEAEGHIFEFLKDDRSHGEWFNRTERVRSIAALIAAGMHIQLAEAIGMDGYVPRGYMDKHIFDYRTP